MAKKLFTEKEVAPAVGICNDITWLIKLREELDSEGVVPKIPISVVIPYYKRLSTLKQTIYSFLKSTYDLSLVEFVIADDGSDLQNRPIIEEYLDLGLNVKYVWHKDEGYRVSAIRNLGIRSASYDNIILIDCDLAVSKNFILDHAWNLYISKRVISVGLRQSRKCTDLDIEIFKDKDPSSIGELVGEDWRLNAWYHKQPNFSISDDCWRHCSGGNVAFHRSIFEDVGGFSSKFSFWGGEDFEWAYRAFKKGYYFYIGNDINAFHFDSKDEEFQVDREEYKQEKERLIRSLVPSRKPYTSKQKGEIPFVSVFITLHNKAEFLREAINSVPRATKKRFEIVLLDDGSTDNYIEVLDSLHEAFKTIIRVFKKSHEGVELAYKDCISFCRGEYIVQLDADDILLPNSIDLLVNELEGSMYDLAYGKYKSFQTDTLDTIEGWCHPFCDRYLSVYKGMYTHPVRVFRSRAVFRSNFEAVLGLQAAVDFRLYSSLLMNCYGLFVDQFTYLYRQCENSISSTKKKRQINDTINVVEHNLKKSFVHSGSTFELRHKSAPNYSFDIYVDTDLKHSIYLRHLGISKDLESRIYKNIDNYIAETYLMLIKMHKNRSLKTNIKVMELLIK